MTEQIQRGNEMKTYQVQVGNENETRTIAATTPREAAEKGVRAYRRERSFFANECGFPAVMVENVEFTPLAYSERQDNVYDA